MSDPTTTRNAPPSDPPTVTASPPPDPVSPTHTTPQETAPPEPPAGPLEVPGFELLEEIARGGMGVVYRARQLGLGRPAAVKMVLGEAAAESREIIRFLAEAEAVAAVRHPNVVQVYAFGEHAGRPYLAMEFCPGGTLSGRLKDGRLPPRDTARLMQFVASAVQAAHDAGIVHRDLKPGNVLFDADGGPKVADFGLAKRGAGGDLTRTVAMMGTPAYMAPEQADGRAKFAGPPADVWALGVILYECLTGRRPFDADDTWSLLQRVRDEAPPLPRTVWAGVPRDLELVCLKCLSKEPHERYPSAGPLADDFGRWLAGLPVSARPANALVRAWKWVRRNRRLAASLAAVVVVSAVGTTVSTYYALRADEGERRAKLAEQDAERSAAEALQTAEVARTSEARAEANAARAATNEKVANEKAGEARRSQAAAVMAYSDVAGHLVDQLDKESDQLFLSQALKRITAEARRAGQTRLRERTEFTLANWIREGVPADATPELRAAHARLVLAHGRIVAGFAKLYPNAVNRAWAESLGALHTLGDDATADEHAYVSLLGASRLFSKPLVDRLRDDPVDASMVAAWADVFSHAERALKQSDERNAIAHYSLGTLLELQLGARSPDLREPLSRISRAAAAADQGAAVRRLTPHTMPGMVAAVHLHLAAAVDNSPRPFQPEQCYAHAESIFSYVAANAYSGTIDRATVGQYMSRAVDAAGRLSISTTTIQRKFLNSWALPPKSWP